MAGGGIFAKKLKEAIKQTKSMKGKALEVGFFSGSTYPDGTKVAEVAYWNEFGRPENNQPPRPFFRNAISEHKVEWVEKIKSLLQQGTTLDQAMTVLGSEIVVDIKNSIRDLKEPALADSTVKSKKAKKSQHPDDPLLDTEVMWNAVQWVINNGD